MQLAVAVFHASVSATYYDCICTTGLNCPTAIHRVTMAQPGHAEYALSRYGLQGKRCLITGATKGIGKAVVEEFCALGAEVTRAKKHPWHETCARSHAYSHDSTHHPDALSSAGVFLLTIPAGCRGMHAGLAGARLARPWLRGRRQQARRVRTAGRTGGRWISQRASGNFHRRCVCARPCPLDTTRGRGGGATQTGRNGGMVSLPLNPDPRPHRCKASYARVAGCRWSRRSVASWTSWVRAWLPRSRRVPRPQGHTPAAVRMPGCPGPGGGDGALRVS